MIRKTGSGETCVFVGFIFSGVSHHLGSGAATTEKSHETILTTFGTAFILRNGILLTNVRSEKGKYG